jgi:hemerythrin-like domain-containing protein
LHHGLQDMLGEVARLRVECDYLTRFLDDLERLSHHGSYLAEHQHDDIVQTTRRYGQSAKDHLEMATSNLQAWLAVVDKTLRATSI